MAQDGAFGKASRTGRVLDLRSIVRPHVRKVAGTVAVSKQNLMIIEINDFAEGPEYGHGVYNVTFDDAEASVERIIEAVMANGYPAQVLSDPAS